MRRRSLAILIKRYSENTPSSRILFIQLNKTNDDPLLASNLRLYRVKAWRCDIWKVKRIDLAMRCDLSKEPKKISISPSGIGSCLRSCGPGCIELTERKRGVAVPI